MSVVPEQWPRDLLTLDDWDALPEDSTRRYELVEGVVAVSPLPRARHQLVASELWFALDRALRPRWCAIAPFDVVVDASATPTVRGPDIAVVDRAVLDDDRARAVPGEVLAVVEVQSPGTRRTDRIAKVADYAEAGIECYLLVEPGPPTVLTELRLRDGAYEQVAEHTGTAGITLDGVAVTIDLAGMLDP